MDRLTTELGQALREFEGTVCSAYTTKELPREMAARERKWKAREAAQNDAPPEPSLQPPKNTDCPKPPKEEFKQQVRSLNLETYKFHSLGDYVETIRQYGTTDSYNSETVRINFFLRAFS